MSSEDEIFEYLTQPENLPIALEIADYVEQLKHKLHRKFWTTFNPRMEQRLKISEYNSTWVFHPHPARRYRTEWGKSYIAPAGKNYKSISQLRVAFGQGSRSNDYRFFWGANWIKEPENFDNPAMTKLKAELIARDINIVEKHWPGWGRYKYSPYDSQFMIRMYRDTEELIAEIVEDVWKLFTDLRPIIEEINDSLGVAK